MFSYRNVPSAAIPWAMPCLRRLAPRHSRLCPWKGVSAVNLLIPIPMEPESGAERAAHAVMNNSLSMHMWSELTGFREDDGGGGDMMMMMMVIIF